jgi:nucleoside-diphosphate-sugar epimerase
MYYVIISGGGGFLGLNLTKALLNSERELGIIILDNFKTSSRENVQEISESFPNRIHLYEVDVTKWREFSFLLHFEFPIKEIYHFASIASPKLYSQFPMETLEAGYSGTKNLLELAASLPSKPRFIFASSSEVYGQPLVHPQGEDYYGNVNSYGTRSCYDESKRVGETLVWIYNKTRGVDTRIVRIFNTYGPYMNLDDGRIVTEIIKSYIKRTPLKIFGDGNQTRCFSYVDDTISSIITIMKADSSIKGINDPINVGSDIEITVNQLVELFQVITGSQLEKEYVSIDKDDPLLRKPLLTRLNEIYWATNGTHKVFTPIQRGFSDTFTYFLKKNKNP